MMWKQSVWTSVIAAGLGARHLKEGGVLVLTGAQAALSATPGRRPLWALPIGALFKHFL